MQMLIVTMIVVFFASAACGGERTYEASPYDTDFATGLVEPSGWQAEVAPKSMLEVKEDLPAKFQWPATPIRNQGACGSCWAFSMAATFADVLNVLKLGAFDFSEQHLVSCDTRANGCAGGWLDFHLYQSNGWVKEAEFPYVARDIRCKPGLTYNHKIKSYSVIGRGVPSPDQIKRAIWLYGPVSVAVNADAVFQAYRSGVFQAGASGDINHAVNLIGWDETTNPKHWIMRNSWGKGWGENGFMRIAYGARRIGYAATFIDFSGPLPHDKPPEPQPAPSCGAVRGNASFILPALGLLAIMLIGAIYIGRQK